MRKWRIEAENEKLKEEFLEVPLIIGGEKVFTGNTQDMVIPHDNKKVIGEYHLVSKEDAEKVIEKAIEARKAWAKLDWDDRVSIFLRVAALAEAGTNGVIFVQLATQTVLGNLSHIFIAIMLALFSFTCLISYYYEAETAAMYLFQKESQKSTRKVVTWIMRIGMPILIFIWGNIESSVAWDLSDLALGTCTWVNMLAVMMLSSKSISLYKDYDEQMKKGIDPYYDPDKLSWKGVDVEMWKDINKKRIEENKNK